MNFMEAFMLLSINEKNGALLSSRTMLSYGLAGVALYELYSLGRLSFDGKKISLNTESRTGNGLLDEALNYLAKSRDAYRTVTLVVRLPRRIKRITGRVLEGLEDRGILRIDQNRFLGLIPYNRYIITKGSEYKKPVNEIRRIIRENDERAEPGAAMMISMLGSCNVLWRHFDKNERKQYRDTLRRISRTDYFKTLDAFGIEVNKAVKKAIAASQAAAS